METKIKNLLIKLLIPLILFGVPFCLPIYTLSFDVSLFLTVVSLIFGILVGFFIATATTNYLNLNNQLAEANSLLSIVYNLSKLLSPIKSKKLADQIDRYLIATIDYPLADHAQKTEGEFNDVIEAIDSIKIKKGSSQDSVIFQNLHNAKADLIKKRQIIVQIAPRIITFAHWFIIYVLTSLIVLMMFSLRDGNVVSNIFFSFIFICFYFLLVILYQIDSDEFLESQLGYEDVQLVFKSIGKTRYYTQASLISGVAKRPKENYRIGIQNNKTSHKDIRLISNK